LRKRDHFENIEKIIRVIGLSVFHSTPSIVSAAADKAQSSKTSVIQIYLQAKKAS